MLKISLVIPVFNEEVNLQKGVLDKIGNYILNNPDFHEVIIVDDGSNDTTSQIIKKKYLIEYKKFKLIENRHMGKAAAIITGINKSNGDYVMFSDIDLATPIEEAEKLIEHISNGYDIVIGSRKSKRKGAPILRKVMALGAILIRDLLIDLKGIRDTQCGFKLFKISAAKKIIKNLIVYSHSEVVKGSSISAGFDIEFLFVAKKLGYKIKEVPVSWKHVETKNVNFLRDSYEALKDILKIKINEIKKQYDFLNK
jgi:glycosyltransferase involved in cell wall biosynthesis